MLVMYVVLSPCTVCAVRLAVDAKVLELYVPLILISTEYSWIGSEGGRNEDFKLSYKVTDTSCVGAC